MIYVSRTFLPSIRDYNKYLERIWKSNWLTNNGELVQELEKRLQDYWNVKHVICVDHGTSAIQIALKILNSKEVYMSPFNFIACGAAANWLDIKIRFVDLNEDYGSPALVTHNYGIPEFTDTKPVIYDASHAFALKYEGKSIVSYGDMSIVSFHAVKIFQTVEGGAIVTNDDGYAEKARWMRNFGEINRYKFYTDATNFKMSEFHAAMGLAVLPQVDKVVKRYSEIIRKYNEAFGYDYKNITYYPLFFENEERVLEAIKLYEKEKIFPRRYFYPPLNWVFKGRRCRLAENKSMTVLALPLYYELKDSEVDKIIEIALEV